MARPSYRCTGSRCTVHRLGAAFPNWLLRAHRAALVGVLEVGRLRPTPVLFALLASICFGGVVFSENGTLVLVVLGVVFIVTAFYAWMIL